MDSIINSYARIILILFAFLGLNKAVGQIQINTNFEVLGNLHIDTRSSIPTLIDTNLIVWTVPGLETYVVDVDQFWYYDGFGWVERAGGGADSSIYELIKLGNVTIAGNNALNFTDLTNFNVVGSGFVQITKTGTLGFMEIEAEDDQLRVVGRDLYLSGDTIINIVTTEAGDITIDAFLGSVRIDAQDSIVFFDGSYNFSNSQPADSSFHFWPTSNGGTFMTITQLRALISGGPGANSIYTASGTVPVDVVATITNDLWFTGATNQMAVFM